jgi:hypothetical protein
MFNRIWFIPNYFINIVGAVIITRVTVFTLAFISVIAKIPATTGPAKISHTEIFISFYFERH